MPSLTCYRIRQTIDATPVESFDDVIDVGEFRVTEYGPSEGEDFTAQLYVINGYAQDPRWASFLREGFGQDLRIARSASPAALLLVRVKHRRRDLMFAFAFGTAGRFLLRSDGYERGYGLRTALNVLYPRADTGLDPARLKSIDSKRRGKTIIRSRFQASETSTFETFDINRLRDVVSKATGVPSNRETWGARLGGGDALALGLDLDFDRLGKLCRNIEDAHARDDYRDQFGWIDFIQPVSDPEVRRRLEDEVLERLRREELSDLGLSPPEVVDWDRVVAFHFHYDRPQGPREHQSVPTHLDLRLGDYMRGLRAHHALDGLILAYLRQREITAIDSDGMPVHKWRVWHCLVGELQLEGRSFVLDEGEFFEVESDYLSDLDEYIDGLPESNVDLPVSAVGELESVYNRHAAASSNQFVLLDARNVVLPSRTTPIEICDILTKSRQLIHVKRHLGSSDLSHLFAQGLVSADLLQMSTDFRVAANSRIKAEAAGRDGFDFFDVPSIAPREFEIVYAIVEQWNGRTMTQALPFFSKVNLREAANNLRTRGFRIALKQVPVAQMGTN